MREFLINFNYYIDSYPWRSTIVIFSVVGLACLTLLQGLFILAGFLYIIFIFIITFRSFYDGRNTEKFEGNWFYNNHRNNFFMFKPTDTYSVDYNVFRYNLKESAYFKQLGLKYKKYEMYTIGRYELNLAYSRLVTKKEIEKYNLNILEAKILLLND